MESSPFLLIAPFWTPSPGRIRDGACGGRGADPIPSALAAKRRSGRFASPMKRHQLARAQGRHSIGLALLVGEFDQHCKLAIVRQVFHHRTDLSARQMEFRHVFRSMRRPQAKRSVS